jgi:hypothetical protein
MDGGVPRPPTVQDEAQLLRLVSHRATHCRRRPQRTCALLFVLFGQLACFFLLYRPLRRTFSLFATTISPRLAWDFICSCILILAVSFHLSLCLFSLPVPYGL